MTHQPSETRHALLAIRDRHPVTHVAAYLARYELLIRYLIQLCWTSCRRTGARCRGRKPTCGRIRASEPLAP